MDRNLKEQYQQVSKSDFYVDDKIYREYLAGKRSGIHFNSASIAAPFPTARAVAQNIFSLESKLTAKEKIKILNTARKQATELVNLTNTRGVVFGRNTTEAASFVFWFAAVKAGDKVVLTNGENPSIRRIFEWHLDHGNPKGQDGWSAYQTFYRARGPHYPDFIPRPTGVETVVIDALNSSQPALEQEIERNIDANTKVFVFSHVLRDSGRELPAKQLCRLARQIKAHKNPVDPNLFVLIDGAQALGNLPRVDFAELGCDAYVGTPHKTMRSEVIGLLFFDPANPLIRRNLEKLNKLQSTREQVILEGFFDPRLGIKPNVPDSISYADVAGFSEAMKQLAKHGLRHGDFSKIAAARSALRQYFEQCLRVLARETDARIEMPFNENPSSFILNFLVRNINGKETARQLAQQGVFLSFINRDALNPNAQYFRVSFQPDNTREEVDQAIAVLKTILDSKMASRR